MRQLLATTLVAALTFGPLMTPEIAFGASSSESAPTGRPSTPIKHLVIVFQENISFDHYFGTYPKALNPSGEPRFVPFPNTPTVNGLFTALRIANPNLNPANGSGATNPFRLHRSQAVTNDQDHDYGPEQAAFDGGVMDLFPLNVGTPGPPPNPPPGTVSTTGLNLGYFDGNTVTALWNYAQYYAMSDNSYSTTFGPVHVDSEPGSGEGSRQELETEFSLRVTSFSADKLDKALFQIPPDYKESHVELRDMWISGIGQ